MKFSVVCLNYIFNDDMKTYCFLLLRYFCKSSSKDESFGFRSTFSDDLNC